MTLLGSETFYHVYSTLKPMVLKDAGVGYVVMDMYAYVSHVCISISCISSCLV
jgi:hypothetical protein